MYFYGKRRIDSQGRIVLTDFFAEKEMPKRVGLSIDMDNSQMILVENCDRIGSNIPATPITVDDKNRICIPKWILEELDFGECGENKELFFVFHKGDCYLSPKTGSIL